MAEAPPRAPAALERIDLHLIRVLHTVLTERSVSRAALRLGTHQPAVSAALKRLRALTGDALLVRSGGGMVPTDVALGMVEPAAGILRAADLLFGNTRSFDARTAEHVFRIAASDYLDPLFLPALVSRLKREAPLVRIEIHALSPESDYHAHLAQGALDLVIGNWLAPPGELHMARLFGDEVVSVVSREHPAARRGWDAQTWLDAEHVAPTATHPGARGVIDQMLDAQGLRRNIAVRCAHFGLIPDMVAGSLLVLTTGRQYCERVAQRLPLVILDCPVRLPPLTYYQLWHARSHASSPSQWLRALTREVAASLPRPGR